MRSVAWSVTAIDACWWWVGVGDKIAGTNGTVQGRQVRQVRQGRQSRIDETDETRIDSAVEYSRVQYEKDLIAGM
jgi:hypothetical protein